jgi:hypothetical protein
LQLGVDSVKKSVTLEARFGEKGKQSTNLRYKMTKSEIRELQIITKYSAAGLGPDYVARAISSLIRAARSKKSADALRAHALAFGVTNHPEFIA